MRPAKLISCAVVAALLASTPVGATTVAGPVQAQPAQAQSPWMTLSMLTPVSSTVIPESAAAAAAVQPGPPPPNAGPGFPPIPVLAIWLGALVLFIWIATKNHHGHSEFPISPD